MAAVDCDEIIELTLRRISRSLEWHHLTDSPAELDSFGVANGSCKVNRPAEVACGVFRDVRV
jgi:hypothetical protein